MIGPSRDSITEESLLEAQPETALQVTDARCKHKYLRQHPYLDIHLRI
jgi:hypothetical protein